jgi:alpha-glucoside transport system substrate-binding protein
MSLVLALAGCSSSNNNNSSAKTASNKQSGGTSASDPLQQALAGKYKGQTVNIMGPFTGTDETNFKQSIQGFEQKTGIQINYEGSNDFTNTINVRMQGGNPPDIADIAQPGLVAKFAKQGKVIDLSKFLTDAYITKQYGQGWLNLSKLDGPNGSKITAGVFQRVNAKGLVYYNVKNFQEAGYKVPKTWDDLIKLSNQIVNDGYTPWTLAEGAGGATGWYGTDWLEAMMLRTTTVDNYNKWINGDLSFTSPEVKKALSYVDQIWKNNKFVSGGTSSIASTSENDMAPMLFTNPPKAFMELNGNFVASDIPKNVSTSDYSFFVLPSVDPQNPAPLEVGGDMMVMLKDRPVIRAVMEYFTTGQSLEGWIKAGGCIAPQRDVNLNWYPDPVSKKVAQTIMNAKTLVFDASDSMPASVGTGSFWKAMTDYVSTNQSDDQILQEAQAGFSGK